MLKKSNYLPGKDYILSSISILFDLLDIYKEKILILIEDDSFKRLTKLAHSTRDGEIIDINESLQNYIDTSKYNFQLNQDNEIF